MGVTAVHMDMVTDSSGHQAIGMAPSVCTTPAAPSPLPIPYPITASSSEGGIKPASRTKVEGANVLTVGSDLKACHGNEPGTLKEVVSLNTGGPTFILVGAPTVYIEMGMAGITGGPGMMNRMMTGGASGSASAASGTGGAGSGGGGGGGGAGGPSGPGGPGGGGGGGGGSASGASGLKGVSKEEMALAAKPGNTKEQIKAREKVAKRFYKQKGGMTAAEARSNMKGMDMNKPVIVGPPPPCPTPRTQWQAAGARQGQYYADSSATPNSLGIHDKGATMGPGGWGTGPVQPKVTKTYDVPPSTPYMSSSAGPIKDTWSSPGHSHGTDGGSQQQFIPRSSPGVNEKKP